MILLAENKELEIGQRTEAILVVASSTTSRSLVDAYISAIESVSEGKCQHVFEESPLRARLKYWEDLLYIIHIGNGDICIFA
jgi:hypothetical protein